MTAVTSGHTRPGIRLPGILLAFAASLLMTGLTAAAPPVTKDHLLELQDQLLDALTGPDIPAAASLMSDKLVYIHAVGLVVSRAQQLERMKAGRHSVARAVGTIVQIHGDTALLTGEVQYTNPPTAAAPACGEQEKPRRFEISTLWAREGKDWRVVFWQATPITEPSR